jgi:prepilin signal peptidase PulO-like enzyme (type II secretory pathway)
MTTDPSLDSNDQAAIFEAKPRAEPTPKMQDRRLRRWIRVYANLFVCFLAVSLAIVSGGSIAYFQSGRDFSSPLAVNDFVLCRVFEWFLGIWIAILGACIASFLNVVAYRVPRGLTVTGHSYCPVCKTPIDKRDNLPVLGWIFLQGRCRTCRLPISARYPIIEAMGGLLLLSLFLSTVLSHGLNIPSVHQTALPYGLPVNLKLLEPIVFVFAAVHGVLIFVLFTAALTKISSGVLPAWFWLGALGLSFMTVMWNPELTVLPLSRMSLDQDSAHIWEEGQSSIESSAQSLHPSNRKASIYSTTDVDDDGHVLIDRKTALKTWMVGALVGIASGLILCRFKLSSGGSMTFAAVLLISTLLGIEGLMISLGIALILRVSAILLIGKGPSFTAENSWLVKEAAILVAKFFNSGFVGIAWFATTVLMLIWSPVHEIILMGLPLYGVALIALVLSGALSVWEKTESIDIL